MKDPLGKVLMRWRIGAVRPHLAGRLLDIGCGTNQLVRAHGQGVGVDVFPWEGADLVVDDTAHLPFADGEFATVTIIAALNHIPNRREVLREAHRLLEPGGRIVLTMIPPRISALWHALRRPWDHDQTERGMQPGEVYGLTPTAMRALLAEAGFVVEREQRFMLGVNRVTIARKPAAAARAAA